MKILICDDEPQFIKIMIKYIRRYEQGVQDFFLIYTYQCADLMMELVRQISDIDIIFLDVILINEDGIETAKNIRKFNQKVKIVFVSSHIEFATKGYDVDAIGYMLKPIEYKSFKIKMNDIIGKINKEETNHFWDKTDKGNVLFELNDILYIETYGRNVRIHVRNNTYITYKKMKYYEALLKEESFYRCHAAYIVNMQAVQRIDEMKIFLKDGSVVMISRGRKKEFMLEFLKYVESQISSL